MRLEAGWLAAHVLVCLMGGRWGGDAEISQRVCSVLLLLPQAGMSGFMDTNGRGKWDFEAGGSPRAPVDAHLRGRGGDGGRSGGVGGRQAGAVPKQKQSCLLEESVFLLWNPTQTGGQSHLTRDRSGAFRGLARRATLGENGHLPERRPRGTGGSSRELVNGVNQGSALTPGCGASGRGSLRRLPWALVSSSVRWGINSTWVTGFMQNA